MTHSSDRSMVEMALGDWALPHGNRPLSLCKPVQALCSVAVCHRDMAGNKTKDRFTYLWKGRGERQRETDRDRQRQTERN